MFIIPLPWKIDELRTLTKYHEVFNVCMDDCPEPSFIIIQGNTLTWLQEGTVVGKVALQIRTRSTTMRKNDSFHADALKNHGNVGFMGNFSSSTDAVQKIFPKTGHCISNSKFEAYSGQKLTGVKNHYTIIVPILCLLSVYPEKEISNLSTILSCKGIWENMQLYVSGKQVDTLEEWFTAYCSHYYGDKSGPSSDGCYIATAVYGSYDCPEVWVLRRYRDMCLKKHILGRCFIKIYYKVSPAMVAKLGNKKWFSILFKPMLDNLVARLLNKGYESTNYYDDKEITE